MWPSDRPSSVTTGARRSAETRVMRRAVARAACLLAPRLGSGRSRAPLRRAEPWDRRRSHRARRAAALSDGWLSRRSNVSAAARASAMSFVVSSARPRFGCAEARTLASSAASSPSSLAWVSVNASVASPFTALFAVIAPSVAIDCSEAASCSTRNAVTVPPRHPLSRNATRNKAARARRLGLRLRHTRKFVTRTASRQTI